MKSDFKKELDCYRARHDEFRVVDVPPLQYLMVDGHGDPNTAQEYADAIAALYPLAYTLKFASMEVSGRGPGSSWVVTDWLGNRFICSTPCSMSRMLRMSPSETGKAFDQPVPGCGPAGPTSTPSSTPR